MGEYAQFNGDKIKIGTCEQMFYLRWEDRYRVKPLSGSLNPAKEQGLFFRLPFPDEDHLDPGQYFDPDRGIRLYKTEPNDQGYEEIVDFDTSVLAETPGQIQVSADNGYLLSIVCYHGYKLPNIGGGLLAAHWGGKTHSIELIAIKPTNDGMRGVIHCRHCRKMWSDDLTSLVEWVPNETLRQRLSQYALELARKD